MQRLRPALASLLLLCLLSSCGKLTYSRVTTTTGPRGPVVDAELQGNGARLVAAGAVLEIRDGQLWVDARSFGAVGQRQTVRYRVDGQERSVTVDGEPRDAK